MLEEKRNLQKINIFFKTANLIIDKLNMSDVERFHEICNQRFILKWMPDWNMNIEQVKKLLNYFITGYDICNPQQVPYILALRRNNILIGICGFGPKEELDGGIEICYFIDQRFAAKGYMGEVFSKAVDYYYSLTDNNKVAALVENANIPSMRLLLNNGFKYMGDIYSDGILKRQYVLIRERKEFIMERYSITLATSVDVAFVGKLYDKVNDHFEETINYNYPNWQKGKYPVLSTAQEAFERNTLYVMKINEKIIASIIIDGQQHPEYKKIAWTKQLPDENVMCLHTIVVDPEVRNMGIGEKIVKFGIEICRKTGVKVIRLDTHFANRPARHLYEKCGFKSLGLQKAFVDDIFQEFDVFEYYF